MPENFAALLEAFARRFPDHLALVWNGGSLTCAGLELRARGFARSLAGQGVKPGDRLAVWIPNRWSFVVAILGGLKLGATVAPLDTRLTREEREAILADLAPALLVREVAIDEGLLPTPAAADSPALILSTSGSSGQPRGAILSHQGLTFANQSWAGPVMALTARAGGDAGGPGGRVAQDRRPRRRDA